MARKPGKSKKLLTHAMREVHRNEPSTVARANVSDTRKEKMRQAIAFSKARAAGMRERRKTEKAMPETRGLKGKNRPRGSGPFTLHELAQGYKPC